MLLRFDSSPPVTTRQCALEPSSDSTSKMTRPLFTRMRSPTERSPISCLCVTDTRVSSPSTSSVVKVNSLPSRTMPIYLFGQTMNPVIRSDGSPRWAMVSMLAGAILNVILDPVAIFLLHWGVAGAAIATVAGQLVTAVLAVIYLFRMKAIRLTKASFRLDGKLIGRFLSLGICSFLAQISLVIAMAATNNMLVRYGAGTQYGSDIPLTVLGIVMKVFQIIISVVIGMSAGCIPIVGYNYGAGNLTRCRSVLWRLIGCETALGVFSLALVELFPRQLIGIFGAEDALYNQFAVLTFRVYLCMHCRLSSR